MKTTDLAAVALSTLLWYTVTKKSLILAIKYNFNFLHFRAVKTILWRLCVYNPSVKNAAVSINADRLLISSVLQADGTDYFIPSLHTERNSTNRVIYNTVIFASQQFVEVDGVLGMQVIALPRNHLHLYLFRGLYHTVIFQSIYIYTHTYLSPIWKLKSGATLSDTVGVPPLFFAVTETKPRATKSPVGTKVRSSLIISYLYYVFKKNHIFEPKPVFKFVTYSSKLKVFSEQFEAAIAICVLFRQTTNK